MTKATEIKLDEDRGATKDGFRDRRRGMKLVPASKSVGNCRSFNIGVAEDLFSPRVAAVSDERRSAIKSHANSNSQMPETLRTVATVGVFAVACTLGFLIGIGRRRD